MSGNWTCSSKLCFLKKLPQCFPWETLWGPWVCIPLDQRSKTTSHPKRAKELIAIYRIMHHLWFLVYRQVLPQLHLHLLLHHLHHRIPCLMSTDTLKIQYQKEVEVRVESFGETRCMKPQKPKTKIKIGNRKKYKKVYRMNCLIGDRYSGKIWLMRALQQILGETQSKEVKTLPSHLMNFQLCREHVEPGSGKHSVYTHFPKDPNCGICLKNKITRASCRRRAGTVVPRAEHFWWLYYCRSRESRNNHWHAVVVQDLATRWIQSYPCTTKSSQETQKHQMKFQVPTRKPKVIYTDNSLECGKSCDDLSWDHCTSTPHRSETNGIAERALRCYCSSVWVTTGGRILWNATAICETFKIFCLMGRHIIWKAVRNAL